MNTTLSEPPLKLLWVTPFSKRSAIGRFSHLVTQELSRRGMAVTIGCCEATPPQKSDIRETTLPVILDPKNVSVRLSDFDIVIYNIGNNYIYHGGILSLIDKKSGIFIFHDLFLHDFFYGVLHAENRLDEHDRLVTAIYGPSVHLAAPQSDYGNNLRHRIENYPMTEWLAPKALGCVVHGRFGVPVLQASTAGPVIHLPLAFVDPAAEPPGSAAAQARRPNEPVRVTTFGDANPNKRVDAVLRTIGSSALLRERVHYRVVGNVGDVDRGHLTGLATSLGVQFDMTGAASDEEWERQMSATDIAACLRMPTTETASATAIESMLAGLPIIVTDRGFYQDLPDEFVFKVDPDREEQTLREQLERLVGDPELRISAGREGAHWARQAFSPVAYADDIVSFAREVMREGPAVEVVLKLADVSALLGRRMDDPVIASWVGVAASLFSARHIEGQVRTQFGAMEFANMTCSDAPRELRPGHAEEAGTARGMPQHGNSGRDVLEADDPGDHAVGLEGLLSRAQEESIRKNRLVKQLSFRIQEMQARLNAAADVESAQRTEMAELQRRLDEERESQGRARSELQGQLDLVTYQESSQRRQIGDLWTEQQGLRSEVESTSRSLRASVRLLLASGQHRGQATQRGSGLSGVLRRASSIQGHVDDIVRGTVVGWVWDMRRPDQPLRLRARLGNRVTGTATASMFRSDLAELGYGKGYHGFELRLFETSQDDLDGMTGQLVVETAESPFHCLAILDLRADEDARDLLLGA